MTLPEVIKLFRARTKPTADNYNDEKLRFWPDRVFLELASIALKDGLLDGYRKNTASDKAEYDQRELARMLAMVFDAGVVAGLPVEEVAQ